MKKNIWLMIGMIALLALAAGAYFGATAMMESLMQYRSPLAEHPPEPGEPLGEPLTERVVIILVDALREDTSLDEELMPTLQVLRQQGAWATMRSIPPSYSAPSWTTILSGAWADINDGQPINPPDPDSARPFTQDHLFAAAKRSGYKTAVAGYDWFDGMLANSDIDASFYTLGEDHAADVDVMENALPWLASREFSLVLIHLDQVDHAGHYEGGPRSQPWADAAGRVDTMIKQIVSSLDLQRDSVIVLSDHGQIDRGGHGGQDPITLIEPFILAGAGVIPGEYPDLQMIDVAPTISALLGLNLPASNQGRVLTEMLTIPPEQEALINQALKDQHARLLASYQAAIGFDPSSAPGESASVAMQTARQQRLTHERIPRGMIALVIALVPAVVMYRKRNPAILWLIGGGFLYLVIFNLIYAVIVGKPYSLSSVISADDLIFSTATYAGISLGVSWLLTMLGARMFRTSPASAARYALSFTAVTLYILAWPFLWSYVVNGFEVTWTLPHFPSMFLGFLSIVQGLFVSVIGFLLCGLTALIARFVPTR